jgi:hypothetical protein
MLPISTSLSLSLILSLSQASYTLHRSYSGASFLSGFKHQGLKGDPTGGFVRYVDRPEALSSNLLRINQTTGAVYIGVDYENQAPSGRKSLRVQSREAFTKGLLIADIAHMPVGCATWPAFWLEPGPGRWPHDGEIVSNFFGIICLVVVCPVDVCCCWGFAGYVSVARPRLIDRKMKEKRREEQS